MVKAKGLGRGLDALLGAEPTPASGQHPSLLPVHQLQPGKYQPRSRMDPESLQELSESIRSQGLLQPVLVRPLQDGRYEIIAGERRWRAAQLAGLAEIPVLVRLIPDEATLAVALIENIQREDLNPLEEALGLDRLIREFGMTHDSAAQAVGRSRSAVSNLLRLLNLQDSVRSLLMDGLLEMGHARALLPLPPSRQQAVAAEVVAKRWSVRETEQRVQRLLSDKPRSERHSLARDLVALQDELSDRLGATVTLKSGRGGAGTLAIRYHSLDQLDGLLQLLRA
ncbi:MAG: ParB/RepB/Spo0J family partition protein [Betaproteobacteria bacterium]|nr:ParB/RepB/Spo0J family partition protein [Betaproteobacteria bacterium]MDE2624073.1 ParB/RepB/Spo0J family partition protein [Betaproteobacteria bacterium]